MAHLKRSAAAAFVAAAVAIPFGVAAAVAATGTTEDPHTGTTTTATTTATTPTSTTTTSSTTTSSTTTPSTSTPTTTAEASGAPRTSTTETHTSTSPKPSATPTRIVAKLTGGQERPAPVGAGRAKGSFVATVTDAGALTYRLKFTGLSSSAVAVHIHTGKVGVAGPVVVTLCAKNCVPRTGNITVKKAVVAAIRAGTAYVNVHTNKNPAGEIRGQIGTRT